MMFSSKTCRFVCFFFLSVSTTAETLRGNERKLDTNDIELGEAGGYAILTKTGITTTGVTRIDGNIGVSPIAATSMTGFALSLDSTTQFATSPQIVGTDSGGNVHRAHAASYGGDVATTLTTAISDMKTAYNNAASKDATKTMAYPFTSYTFPSASAGVYKFVTPAGGDAGDVTLSSPITFSGTADDKFIIQITGNLVVNADVILNGSVSAENIVWQVSGHVRLNANKHMEGIILTASKVVFKTGSSLIGRVLAHTACTLDKATITEPNASS
jgi:hypothetical protein